MKLKENFAIRQVADTWVILPVGEAIVDFHGMYTLNETGAVLWQALERGGGREELANALTKEYAVDLQQALTDVDEFLEVLVNVGCIEQ